MGIKVRNIYHRRVNRLQYEYNRQDYALDPKRAPAPPFPLNLGRVRTDTPPIPVDGVVATSATRGCATDPEVEPHVTH